MTINGGLIHYSRKLKNFTVMTGSGIAVFDHPSLAIKHWIREEEQQKTTKKE